MREAFRPSIRRHVRTWSRQLSLRRDKFAPSDTAICQAAHAQVFDHHSRRDSNQDPEHSNAFLLTCPYGSRSLSLQIEAIRRLFSDGPAPQATSGLNTRDCPTRNSCRLPKVPARRSYSEDLTRLGTSSRDWTLGNENHWPSVTRGARCLVNPARIPRRVSSLRSTGNVKAHFLPSSAKFSSMDSIFNEDGNFCHSCTPEAARSHIEDQFQSKVASRQRHIDRPILAFEERRSSLSRKSDICDLRRASIDGHTRSLSLPVRHMDMKARRDSVRATRRPDLFKPLPPLPFVLEDIQPPPQNQDQKSTPRNIETSTEVLHGAERFPTKSTTATTVHRHYAPAVMRNTIERRIHEIREEHITRETHTHDYHDRQLPIIDIELLPTRYFIADEHGTVEEIEEDRVPTELKPSRQEIMDAAMSQLTSMDTVAMQTQDLPLPGNFDGLGDNDVAEGVFTAECRRRKTFVHWQSRVMKSPLPSAEEKHSILLLDFRGGYAGTTDEVFRLRDSSGEDDVKCFL